MWLSIPNLPNISHLKKEFEGRFVEFGKLEDFANFLSYTFIDNIDVEDTAMKLEINM